MDFLTFLNHLDFWGNLWYNKSTFIFSEVVMVVYKLGYSIGRDEEDFTNILFNRPTRYKPFNLDYFA